MGLIYVDSCLLIYAFEQHPIFGEAALARLSTLPAERLAISPLVKMECLVLPLRNSDSRLIERYTVGLLAFRCLEMKEAIFMQAAMLRARHGLKAPDAMHLATAHYYGCDEFWAQDDRLHKAAQRVRVQNIMEA
ncbi:MAG: type II toxin-antitoxin system VapC family toxin [Lautropia sp.]|nr:type II toxin-antitoxin system VapC family toxin [Lautropia sp.]